MTPKKHNYKLTDTQKKELLLSYKLDNSNDNIKALCKKYNITRQTLWNLSKDEKIVNSITEFNDNFTKRANDIIALMLNRIEKQVKDDSEKMQISQLVTSLGILYDKMRLSEGQSTSNNAININIKIE